jgi:hypothetical protein
MSIKLGQKVLDLTSNFVGIAYTIDHHCFGCETVTIMLEGTDDLESSHQVSTSTVKIVDDGILADLGYVPEIKPQFEPGDEVITVMGLRGVITIRSLTLHNIYRYFIEVPNKELNVKPLSIVSFESLMRKV